MPRWRLECGLAVECWTGWLLKVSFFLGKRLKSLCFSDGLDTAVNVTEWSCGDGQQEGGGRDDDIWTNLNIQASCRSLWTWLRTTRIHMHVHRPWQHDRAAVALGGRQLRNCPRWPQAVNFWNLPTPHTKMCLCKDFRNKDHLNIFLVLMLSVRSCVHVRVCVVPVFYSFSPAQIHKLYLNFTYITFIKHTHTKFPSCLQWLWWYMGYKAVLCSAGARHQKPRDKNNVFYW